MCANFILPCGENHYGFFLRCPTSFYNQPCQNDICLSKIAEELSLSANLISRIVKEASHRSFSEYITYKRIQRSKELLADGSMSINAVSEAVGFTYPYYFIRKFKELEGVTPGQYIGAQTPSDG